MSAEVKQLGPEQVSSLRALWSRDPLRNLYPLGMLDELGSSRDGTSAFFGYLASGELRAAAYVNPSRGLVVPGGCEPPDALALGAGLSGQVALRACFGERSTVESLVRALCSSAPLRTRALRLFTASADNLGPFLTPALRLATERDLAQLVPMAAAEIQEVLESEPRREDAQQFEAEVVDRIRRKRAWVLEIEGRLVAKVDVAARSSFGAELQGLFTLPEERFRGHATLALGQLSRHLLSSTPRLTLRIAESSHSLLAVARKVGYVNRPVEQLLAFA